MHRSLRAHMLALLMVLIASTALAQAPNPDRPASQPRAERKPQGRPHGTKVEVDPSRLEVDDGDTAVIRWSASDSETVRFLGIDTPETRHVAHDIPYAQSFGPEARAFAIGAFAFATKVELLRSATLDPYGRSLGYFFINGKNYSVLVVSARFAEETVSRYGDNGLPEPAAAVAAAAKAAGPVPFESPGDFRRRMRDVSRWMKANNISPEE